jgi:G:T/U-mismatch repair DNA glycosylase
MEFFYPNWINDMWRIMGLLFYADKHHFEIKGHKTFDRERIIEFCTTKGIALYDTATEVRRLKDNASDKFLEIVTPTDIDSLIAQLPDATAIVTTGQKATDVIVEHFGCGEPAVGGCVKINISGRELEFWRMPSSSRAYPLKLERKAEAYRAMFDAIF